MRSARYGARATFFQRKSGGNERRCSRPVRRPHAAARPRVTYACRSEAEPWGEAASPESADIDVDAARVRGPGRLHGP